MERVGVVGLGAMGLPMAETLERAGFSVTGYDVDPGKRGRLSGAVDRLEALAGTEAVVLSLPDDAVVEAVSGTLLDVLVPAATIVDTSTIAPTTARSVHARAAEQGIGYVDAPVSGGAAGAAAGSLLVMAGGTEDDLARAEPVLEALARKIARCGGPGSGAVVKIANNLLCAGQLLLAGEALRLAAANGVSADALLEAVNAGSGRSAVTEVNLPRWVLSGSFDSAFSLGLMAKDVSLAERLDGAGVLAAEVAERWREAAEALGSDADFNRIVERPLP